MEWVRLTDEAREVLRVLGAFETYIWTVTECAVRLGWTEQRVSDTLPMLLEERLIAGVGDGYVAAPMAQRAARTTVIYSPSTGAVTIIWPEDDDDAGANCVLDEVLSTRGRHVWRRGQDGPPSLVEILDVPLPPDDLSGERSEDAELLGSLGILDQIGPEYGAATLRRTDVLFDPWDIRLATRFR